jgi:hypothetical protein
MQLADRLNPPCLDTRHKNFPALAENFVSPGIFVEEENIGAHGLAVVGEQFAGSSVEKQAHF